MEEVWRYLDNAFVRSDTFFHDLKQPVNTARAIPERDLKALDLLLHTFEHTEESVMMPVVLHVNNLKQIDGKWPVSEQTAGCGWRRREFADDQPKAFLKFTEAQHPVVSMLASQMVISGGGEGSRGRSGGNQLKEQQKKNEGLSKAAVNTDQAGAAVQYGEPSIRGDHMIKAVPEADAREEVGQAIGRQAVPVLHQA
jgi:hypothetical protein